VGHLKDYIKLVAEDVGWSDVPPGTRKSTYDNPEYKSVPFAAATLQALLSADPTNPAIKPVPYTGIQFVGIPEFQSFLAVLYDREFFGKNVATLLVIAPFFVMPTVSALIWKNFIMHPVYGLVALWLKAIVLAPINWFGDISLFSIIISLHGSGFRLHF
jgi:hypothetical protein